MKKLNILRLLSTVAIAAAGVFGIASVKESKAAESVSAASLKKVFIDFEQVNFRDNAYMHYWGGTGATGWPGTKLSTSNKISSSSIILSNRTALGRDFYYWNVYDDNTTAIFCNFNGSNVWNRWDDMSISSNNLFQPTNWNGSYNTYTVYQITLKKANSSTTTEYHIPAWSGSGYSTPTPTSGYRWIVESTSALWVNGTAISGDLVLKEQLIPPTTYTITYNAGGATGTVPTQSALAAGDTFTVASHGNLMKNGMEFAGWSDGSRTYNAGDTYTMGSENVTLTAQWVTMVTGKVYFTNNFNWDNVSQFSVVTEGVAGSRNYGVTKAYTNENNEDIYYATIPVHNSFRFTNSYDSTVFISGWVENRAYYLLNTQTEGRYNVGTWTVKPYTISYQGNGSTSGTMNAETAYANVSWGLTTNSFVKTGYVFDSWNTRANGTGTKYDNGALLPQDVVASGATITLYAQWRKSYTSGRYVIGNYGSCSGGVEGAQIMTQSGGDLVATVSLEFGDTFKLAWYNDSTGVIDSYRGYDMLVTSCGAYHYFSENNVHDFVCYARGSYTIYTKDSGYGDGKYVSIEVSGALTSEHLAAQLMSFGASPSTGHCGDNDRFPAMKTMYLGLSSGEKSIFQGYSSSEVNQFKHAYDRYTAWARALGENPWAEGKANGVASLMGLTPKTTNNVMILVIITVVSVGAVGGYFFIRKRKEN